MLNAWPGYVAYVVSFLTIGSSWLLHTALTNRLAGVDQLFLRLNLLLLVPFREAHPLGVTWQGPRSF